MRPLIAQVGVFLLVFKLVFLGPIAAGPGGGPQQSGERRLRQPGVGGGQHHGRGNGFLPRSRYHRRIGLGRRLGRPGGSGGVRRLIPSHPAD